MYESKWKQSYLAACIRAGFLLGLFFGAEYGGGTVLRNVGLLSTDYMALHPRRQNYSQVIYTKHRDPRLALLLHTGCPFKISPPSPVTMTRIRLVSSIPGAKY
jgi:hypothetical protein